MWLLRGGTVFDGTGAPGRLADVRVAGGRVVEIGERLEPDGAEVVDAAGCWVTPGFVDLHTHYDAELELAPALSESLRHGVTSVVVGSCGLSVAVGAPEDLADMFCRVEGVPRAAVLPLLERTKTWETHAQYFAHLDALPLGPNVASLCGHSAIRAVAMGLDRSLDPTITPTEVELARMEALLREALDAGFLGLSVNTLPWDKMDGDRHPNVPTPSVFASWKELRRLVRTVRSYGRVFQGVPDVSTKVNAIGFFWESLPFFRRPLRTMLITLLDAKGDRFTHHLVGFGARVVQALGGPIRLQSLPHAFDIWADGLTVPIMEELGAGNVAIGTTDPQERRRLLLDPAFRERFKREWHVVFGKAWHRDLDEARVVSCPDPAVSGRTFGEVARARGRDPVDTFLDLQAEHGDALRWVSVLGNDRPDRVAWIMDHPGVLIGFSDAGAHLRNMAFYNYPLRMLKRVRDAALAGRPIMTTERAIWRLTAEIADFIGVDAGRLRAGGRADLVVIDPARLDDAVEQLHEAPMSGVPGLNRLVRRNDDAVRLVMVGGAPVFERGVAARGLGTERFGSVLRAS
jgi:N-acyl-D-aspartate/D-glutamate deacylase